jgi:hypothetical protein
VIQLSESLKGFFKARQRCAHRSGTYLSDPRLAVSDTGVNQRRDPGFNNPTDI